MRLPDDNMGDRLVVIACVLAFVTVAALMALGVIT